MTTHRNRAGTARTRDDMPKITACAPLLLCIVFAGASASAAGDPAACREIQASMERLNCYDRAVDASRRWSSDREAPPNDAAAAAPTTTPVADAIADRAEAEAVEPAVRDRKTGPTAITTRIAEIRETSIGRQRYVLDNGEVWEQAEFRSASTLKPGDDVVLQETLFGSHRLRPADGRGSSVKVRPLQ